MQMIQDGQFSNAPEKPLRMTGMPESCKVRDLCLAVAILDIVHVASSTGGRTVKILHGQGQLCSYSSEPIYTYHKLNADTLSLRKVQPFFDWSFPMHNYNTSHEKVYRTEVKCTCVPGNEARVFGYGSRLLVYKHVHRVQCW